MNEFQNDVAETAERTLAKRHIEALRQHGGVFVDAVRLTRMPMMVTDATLPGNPIIFANHAFMELSGYSLEELLGQDPHFMNGTQTDPAAIQEYEAAIRERRATTLEIQQYGKGGGCVKRAPGDQADLTSRKVALRFCRTYESLVATS